VYLQYCCNQIKVFPEAHLNRLKSTPRGFAFARGHVNVLAHSHFNFARGQALLVDVVAEHPAA